MSYIAFGSSFSFVTAATPSGWLLGYDTDGILKQKDSSGNITLVGGGPTAGNLGTYSLFDILSIGNNTQTQNIITGTSTYIGSSNGGGKIELDYTGLSGSVLISTDNSAQLDSGLLLGGSYTALFSDGYNKAIDFNGSGNNLSIYNLESDGVISIGVHPTLDYNQIDEIKIVNNTSLTASTGNGDKSAVFIGSKNSQIYPGVSNTVVIGGQNIIASQSNSVYVTDLYLGQLNSIKSIDSNTTFTLHDTNGLTVLGRNGQNYDKSWQLFGSDWSPLVNSLSGKSYRELIEFGVNSDPGFGTNSAIVIHNSKGPSYSWEEYSSVLLDKSLVKIKSSDPDTTLSDIEITLDAENIQATVLGPISQFKGLEYGGDYSSNFTTYSLVDKNYVNSILANPNLSTVLTSGNNSGLNDIIMGTSTVIKSSNGGGQIDLDFSGTQNDVLISNDAGALSKSYILLQDTNMQIETVGQLDLTVNSGYIDTGDSKGLQYSNSFESTFVTYSLVSKRYVDLGTASIWNVLSLSATSSGTNNYVPKWKSSQNLSSTSSVYIGDAVSKDSFTSLQVGQGPIGLAYDGYNELIWVANSTNDNVTIINANTQEIVGTVSVGTYPISVAWDSNYNQIYVANQNSDDVTVIDTITKTVSATISVSNFPTGVIVDNVSAQAFVSCQIASSVVVIDTLTNVVSTSYLINTPRQLAVDYNNNTVWITGVGPDFVAKVDISTFTVLSVVFVGTNPYDVCWDSFNERIYVSNFVSNNVSVIDTTTDSIIGTVSVGTNPDGVSYHPINKTVYVANSGSGQVSVIDTITNTVTSTITVNSSPREFAYDSSNARMIVTNEAIKTVHFIETIDKQDFVGIKTELPTSELDVRGRLTTEELRISTGASKGYILVSDDSGIASWTASSFSTSSTSGTSGTSGISPTLNSQMNWSNSANSYQMLQITGVTQSGNMIGATGGFYFTPQSTGDVWVSYQMTTQPTGDAIYELRYGTGSAPDDGDPAQGTAVGERLINSTGYLFQELSYIISGLTPSTQYWFAVNVYSELVGPINVLYDYVNASAIELAGVSGTSGTSGSNGTDGTSGTSGNSGTSGTSAVDGTSGTSGISGIDGALSTRYTLAATYTPPTAPVTSSGNLYTDNLTISGITEFIVHNVNVNSGDYSTLFSSLSTSSNVVVSLTDITDNSILGSWNISTINSSPSETRFVTNTTLASNGVLSISGIYSLSFIVNGTNGTSGTNGSSGTSGSVGATGSTGSNGTSGTSGLNGTSGTSGLNGTSGTSGINGTSGVSSTPTYYSAWSQKVQTKSAFSTTFVDFLENLSVFGGGGVATNNSATFSKYLIVESGDYRFDYMCSIKHELTTDTFATLYLTVNGATWSGSGVNFSTGIVAVYGSGSNVPLHTISGSFMGSLNALDTVELFLYSDSALTITGTQSIPSGKMSVQKLG